MGQLPIEVGGEKNPPVVVGGMVSYLPNRRALECPCNIGKYLEGAKGIG